MYSDLPTWAARLTFTDEQVDRWVEVLDHLAEAVPPGASVVVNGDDGHAAIVADCLADTLRAAARPCARLTDANPLADEDAWRAERTRDTVAVADGPRWLALPPTGAWDVVIWLGTAPDGTRNGHRGHDADMIVDLHDSGGPVVRWRRLPPPDADEQTPAGAGHRDVGIG